MAPGVIGRAREKIPAQGDYLDKDDMVRSGIPFGIVAGGVVWDETGSQFGPRWVVTVEPWYDEDADTGPHGVVTLKDTNIRNAIMNALADEADALQAGDMLGPIVMVKALSSAKNRYFDFADFDEETGRAVGANGREAEPELPSPPPSTGRRPSRPAAQAHRSTGQLERAAAATPEPVKRGRGRPRQQTAPTEASARPSGAPTGSAQATGAEASKAREMQPGEVRTGRASHLEPVSMGSDVFEPCGQEEIVGRVFPDPEGNPVLIHRCPANGNRSIPLPATYVE